MSRSAAVLWVLVVLTGVWAWWPERSGAETTDQLDPALVRADAGIDDLSRSRLVAWDPLSGTQQVVDLRHDEQTGRWTLTGHNDYPADAGSMMGEWIGHLLSVEAGVTVSDDPARHIDYGVVDPLAVDGGEGAGSGARWTLWNEDAATVVDLIIGDAVPSAPEQRYCRRAGEADVTTVILPAPPPATFQAWVDTDLLPREVNDIVQVVIDRHSIDENEQRIARGDQAVLRYDPAQSTWQSTFGDYADRPVDLVALRAVLDAAADMRFHDVEPFSREPAVLAEHGLALSSRGTIYANDGTVTFGCRDGLRYTFYFGQLVGDPDLVARLDAADPLQVRDYRYCFAYTSYDPSLDLRSAPAADEAERLAEGQRRAKERNETLAPWFYIIDDVDYRALAVELEALHKSD